MALPAKGERKKLEKLKQIREKIKKKIAFDKHQDRGRKKKQKKKKKKKKIS